MIEVKRHDTILRLLRSSRVVTVHDVVSMLGVSEATVRRDFSELEDRKMIQRIRGGARLATAAEPGRDGSTQDHLPQLAPIVDEFPFEVRKNTHTEVKRRIAKQAVTLCHDGETIIIDGGTTTYRMVEFLPALDLQVITNSFAIATRLIQNSTCRVIVPGGIVYPDSQLILSPFYDMTYQDYSAVKCFMGAEAIDQRGAVNTNRLLIQAERSMIEHSRALVLLIDSSKFRRQGHLRLCRFDQIDTIITDAGITEEDRRLVTSHGVDLLVV